MNASTSRNPDFEERYYKLSLRLRGNHFGGFALPVVQRFTLWPSWYDFRDGYMGLYEPEDGPPVTQFVRVMRNVVLRIEHEYPSVRKLSRKYLTEHVDRPYLDM